MQMNKVSTDLACRLAALPNVTGIAEDQLLSGGEMSSAWISGASAERRPASFLTRAAQ